MAETVKKTKAPAKPRAAKTQAPTVAAKRAPAAKKQTVADQVTATTPSHEEIARLAQQYWAERGWQEGQAEQDWLRAEQELRKMAS